MMPETAKMLDHGDDVGSAEEDDIKRPLWPALWRGFLCCCPQCGKAKIFAGYLQTVDHCSVCGLEMSGHRADDLPPYLTIFIVGHVVVALYMASDVLFGQSMWAALAVFAPLTVLMSLALLRPLKGATIGLQWSMRMHGFQTEANGGEPQTDH